jgi:hypothetical protein
MQIEYQLYKLLQISIFIDKISEKRSVMIQTGVRF